MNYYNDCDHDVDRDAVEGQVDYVCRYVVVQVLKEIGIKI